MLLLFFQTYIYYSILMINILTILCMAIFLFDASLFSQIIMNTQTQKAVLAAEVLPTVELEPTDTPTPSPTLAPTPTSSPSAKLKLSKKTYSIALFGDSMIDTMGENLE